ncbi:MAG TPA: nitroreductase family protein [Anaerolineales bacterium]
MLPPNRGDYWAFLDGLVAECRVVIDRPKGSSHPRYPDLVYPLDYGYLDGTASMDGSGIDVWVGTQKPPRPDAMIFTLDLKKKDSEAKILLGCNDAEIRVILDFLNANSMRAVLVRRWGPGQEWLRSRRSVRRFQPRPVPPEILERILETATWAPSAHNRQPWRFVVLDSTAAKTRLADGMGGDFRRDLLADGFVESEVEAQVARSRARILEAPAAILLCLDASTGDVYPDPARAQAEQWMGIQGVAMAGQNLLLAAYAEGLGGVWICAPLFAPQTVRQVLDLPMEWQPQGLVLLGYPAKMPEPRLRGSIEKVVRYL